MLLYLFYMVDFIQDFTWWKGFLSPKSLKTASGLQIPVYGPAALAPGEL